MNPLMAAIKGTSKTVSNATESTLQAAKNAVISPNVAYSLGMGIGPWLRNMANAADKKDDKKDSKKSEAGGLAKKEFTLLSTQFNTMVSILRDIRNIGMTQLRADQQRLIDARRQEYFSKEAASETSKSIGASLTGTGKDREGKSSLSVLGDMMPTVLKILAGGAIAGGVWNQIFDDTSRQKIKETLFGDKGVWQTISDKYVEALKSDPVTTAVGTLIAARVTGVLAALGFAGKFLYHGGKIVGQASSAVGNVMHGSLGNAAAGGRTGVQAAGATELQQLSNAGKNIPPTTLPSTVQQQSTAGMTPAEKLKYRRLMREEVARNNAAASAAEATAETAAAKATADATKQSVGMMSKLAPIIATTGRVLSGGLLGLGAGISAFNAKEDFEQGKTWAGSLNALSATLGAGALGSLFVPGVGPLMSGVLATGSALTGLAGAAVSYFEKGNKDRSAMQTPSPSATNVERNSKAQSNIPAEEVMGIIQSKFAGAGYGANQTWAALSNAARESQFIVNAHNGRGEDSWGIFQMNRRNGMGAGHTPEQLSDPSYNTDLLLANLRAAENRNDYFGKEARAFRDATSKEEAAEHLRRFLFGNGTASQQMAGLAKQNEVNSNFEAGRYGRVPDFSKQPTLTATSNGTTGTTSQPLAGITPSSVTSSDAMSGGILSEITQLTQDLNKILAGGLMMASNDTNTTINNANMSGGGAPSPRIDTSLIQQTTQHVAP